MPQPGKSEFIVLWTSLFVKEIFKVHIKECLADESAFISSIFTNCAYVFNLVNCKNSENATPPLSKPQRNADWIRIRCAVHFSYNCTKTVRIIWASEICKFVNSETLAASEWLLVSRCNLVCVCYRIYNLIRSTMLHE